MPSLLSRFEQKIYNDFYEAAEGLEIEFGSKAVVFFGQKDAIDDVFDDAYGLVDELYDRDEEPSLNSEAVKIVNTLNMIALCDAVEFIVPEETTTDGENFYD